jgi:hypothetical protein
MATHDNGTPDTSDEMDLDRVIGELETEAAHRRAEPGFPHDADARLHFELARQAPNPPGAMPMHDVIAQIEEIASETVSPSVPASGPRRSRRREADAVSEHVRRLESQVKATGLAAAGALHAMAGRLEQLEARVGSLEPIPETAEPPLPLDETDSLMVWWARLADPLSHGERVLYAQSRADEVIAELRSAGFDAYGITSSDPEHRPGPDVRSGSVLTHLGAVPDAALGTVMLAGVPEVMSPHAIGPLVSELARVATTVVVISEAPWWWRLRLGAVNADLAVARPLDPDTWLHAFHGVAMTGSAEYDPTGQTYRVVVRTRA